MRTLRALRAVAVAACVSGARSEVEKLAGLRSLADCSVLQVGLDTAAAVACAVKTAGTASNQCAQAQAFLDAYVACAKADAPCAPVDCEGAKGITFKTLNGQACNLTCPGVLERTVSSTAR
jgi:hypothetical protein